MYIRYVYVGIFTVLILTLITCAVNAKHHHKDLGRAVALLDIAFIPPILGKAVVIFATRKWVALAGFYVFLTGIDFVVFEMVRFTEEYCKGAGRNPKAPKWVKWVLLADTVQIIVNFFTKHAFDTEWVVHRNQIFYVLKPNAGLVIHWIISYGIFLAVIVYFGVITFRASHIYRERYLLIFVSMTGVGIWEAYCMISKNPIDQSIIGLGAFGVLAYYFAIHYRPLKLLDKILSGIVSNGTDACFIFSPRGRCVWVNKAASILVGVQEETSEKAPEALEYLFNTKLRRGNWSEQHMTGAGDCIKYYLFENRDVFNEKGKINGYYLKVSDITEEQLRIRKELFEASHDRLTGLYNKDQLFKIIRQTVDVHKDTGYMVLYVNIRNFKVVNDIFGNDFGDYAIRCFAEKMKEIFSKRAVYGRLSGANFGILIPKDEFKPSDLEHELALINVTQDAVKFPIQTQIGAYEIDREEKDVDSMFVNARLALITIENDDSKHLAYYDDKLKKEILWNQEITTQLVDAIKDRDIRPYLQPIADSDGNIVGCEALVRWIHKDHGFLSPIRFIPSLEKNGMIAEVDKYMWRCACEILSDWKKRGWDLFVSVNISPKDFYYIDVPKYIKGLVEEYGLDPKQLRVEITETVMVNDADKVIAIMEEFRSYGFIIEMDDFGSGYSSLNMLKDLPVDILKIDMNFLGKTDDEERADTIVKNVIHLTMDLGLTALTEGVETQNQYDILADMGCKLFQGYYLSKPVPTEEFEKLVIVKNK
ncbi:MAG: EAL domain-containing protein [Lachnospiraceae bacterium]|nr:EAL domain-containing protein [Lachnospiraceae bacterium]